MHLHPEPKAQVQTFPEGFRPGERMVAGRPYVFNAGLLGLHLANEAVQSAPEDLSGLTYDEVFGLWCSAHKLTSSRPIDRVNLPYSVDLEMARDVARRAADERATRPDYQRAYGSAA